MERQVIFGDTSIAIHTYTFVGSDIREISTAIPPCIVCLIGVDKNNTYLLISYTWFRRRTLFFFCFRQLVM